MVAGANAVVVGLLAAALYDPVWTGTIRHAADVLVVLAAFALLAAMRLSAAWVAVFCIAAAFGIAAYASEAGRAIAVLP